MIAQQEQSGLSAAANAPSGVRRTTQLADAQHIARIKSAYHGLKHPTVSINAGGDNLQFAQSIFANLEGVLSDAEKQLRDINAQLPAFSRLVQEYRVVMSTAQDGDTQSDYFEMLTDFFHEERLAEMRKAITRLAVYMDESTDISTTAHMLLCVSYIDSDGKFRDELMEIFDVSEEGATVGAALEDKVFKFLREHQLLDMVDASFVDGASNVCDYPTRGHTLSYAALQKKRLEVGLQKVLTWWCLAHRYNLALGDVLKSKSCQELVKCLRLLVAFTRTSSYNGHVDAEAAELRKAIDKKEALLPDLDAQISRLMDLDEDQKNAAFQREVDALVSQKNEAKLSKDEFDLKVKILGRKHKLKSYMAVRWLSLFDTIDSIISQFSTLGAILLKKAKPFQDKIDAGQVDINSSILLVERTLFSFRKKDGGENDDAEAEQEEPGVDVDAHPEVSAPAVQKISTRKLLPGEKAYHLHRKLIENQLFLVFLSNFGQHYRFIIKFFQNTKEPIAHLLYYEHLRFHQLLFNLCLQFDLPAEVKELPVNEEPVVAKPLEPARRGARSRKVKQRLAEEDALYKYCVCQKPYDFDNEAKNGIMIECGWGDACQNPQKWWHITCVKIQKKDLEKKFWMCEECTNKRNRPDDRVLGGHMVVVQPPTPAWRAAAADEYIPDASDIKEQFWDQSFRQALRHNSRIQKRPLDDVSWATFPAVAALITKGTASRAQVYTLQDFVHLFVCNINDRLAHKNDIFTLESCSVFDPRTRSKLRNAPMRTRYLRHLCQLSGADESAVLTASVPWFTQVDAFDEAKDSICSYFVRLRASSASLKPLVDLGLNFLKNLFGTSCVEARFSTVSIVKSKQRSILSTAKLRG